MNELEEYLGWVIARLDQDQTANEEPDLELKSCYKTDQPESDQLWEIADLISALANDPRIDGYRSLVFGPVPNLARPEWLSDESRLRDKLLRYFEGGVVPGVELLRREIGERGLIDAFVIVERESIPYVTRLAPGGVWVVRVRTNTARRTATRSELIALAKGRGPTGGPIRRLDARVAALGKHTKKIVVTNVGTIPVKDIRMDVPGDSETRPFGEGSGTIDLLNPNERDIIPILGPGGMMNSGVKSERVVIKGTAEDGEPVSTSVLVSSFE